MEKLTDGRRRVEIVPREAAGSRLDQALARMFPELSRSRLASWMRAGHVRVDGAPRDPKHRVWGGERIELDAPAAPEETAYRPEALALQIVYEDAAIAVIDKPAGLVVHPGSGNWAGTLANALLHHAPQVNEVPRAGIVHRLDKDTSGLMVVAKTLVAQTSLVRQLQARTVRRDYVAVVHGAVARDGSVDAPVGRDPRARTRMAVVAHGKPARTHYRVIERLGAFTLLECSLDTGRTHQIRVHMARIGHPIAGDPVYRSGKGGSLPAPGMKRQALHARHLKIVHPVSGVPMEWEAALPADLAAFIAALRAAPR
jgi:23S rRNA pseudouridine1911/1915/1917 synthase